MAGIYTTLFNVERELFDIKGALRNWSHYADELIIATVKGQSRKVANAVSKAGAEFDRFAVVEADFDFEDPRFDGKLKNVALQECESEFVIQQDFDERIGGKPENWGGYIEFLKGAKDYSALMVPNIDLYGEIGRYKSLGGKWYLHRKEGTFRGPVWFAVREDGTVDTDRSDGCELIDSNGNLVKWTWAGPWGPPERDIFDPTIPHVVHLGYLNKEKRARHNKEFWEDAWSNLEGKDVELATSVSSLDKENSAHDHGLGNKPWWK